MRAQVIGFALVAFLLSGLWIIDVQAGGLWPQQKGELCWEWERLSPAPSGSGEIKFGISNVGNGHYLLGGTSTNSSYSNIITIVHGNAEIVGNQILITAVGSDADPAAMRTGIFHAILDRLTLNGTYGKIGHQYSSTGGITSDYEHGTLTLIPCE